MPFLAGPCAARGLADPDPPVGESIYFECDDGKTASLDSSCAPQGPMGSFLAFPSTRILPVGPPTTTTMHFSDRASCCVPHQPPNGLSQGNV